MKNQQIELSLKEGSKLHKSLTKSARVDISRVLWIVRERFNSSKINRKGVRDAFKETRDRIHEQLTDKELTFLITENLYLVQEETFWSEESPGRSKS